MIKPLNEHSLYNCLQKFPIYRLSISGGPCGGKTTLLNKIRDQFSKKGFKVISLPQVPTMVFTAGININTFGMKLEQKLKLQSSIMRLKMIIEDEFYKLTANSNQPTIILSDRGTMDSCAYMTKEQFNTVLNHEGWNIISLRDKRYDAVVFLTTAADGAEEFYSLENNEARHQDLQFSKELDLKTLQAWNGHPHLIVIENVKGHSFDKKMEKAIRSIQKVIGFHSDVVKSKQFLVNQITIPKDLYIQTFDVEQTILKNSDSTRVIQDRIRKRGQKGSYTYSRTIRLKGQKQGQTNTIKVPLNPIQYLSLVQQRSDSNFISLKKQRTTFLFHKQVFILDKILIETPITILRYIQKDGSIIIPPPFIKLGQDISQSLLYRSETLAKKKTE